MSAPYHRQNKSLYTLLCFALLFGIANCADMTCNSSPCYQDFDFGETMTDYLDSSFSIYVDLPAAGGEAESFVAIGQRVKRMYISIETRGGVYSKARFTDGQIAIAESDITLSDATIDIPASSPDRFIRFNLRSPSTTSGTITITMRKVAFFDPTTDESSGLSTGAVVAIAVVIPVVVIATIIVGVKCHLQKKRRMATQRKLQSQNQKSTPEPVQQQPQPQQMYAQSQPQYQPYVLQPQPQPQPQLQITIQTGPPQGH